MDRLVKIFEMLPEEADAIAALPDSPHQHDFEELLIGSAGVLDHFIDFKSQRIPAPYISFVTKGKVHRIIPRTKDGKFHVWSIRFKSDFIPETTFHLYTLFNNNANIAMTNGRCFERMVDLCQMMYDELQQEQPAMSIVKHLLSALFVMIETERQKSEAQDTEESSQINVYSNFLELLEAHYKTNESVEYYAEQLFMSSRNLNHITHKVVQQSVSEIIETRKLIEAKNLLTSTEKTIAEIAFEIGYNEKSYFSKVFKKKSGMTPSEFRSEMRKMV